MSACHDATPVVPFSEGLHAAHLSLTGCRMMSHQGMQHSAPETLVQGRHMSDDLCCSRPCSRHPCGPWGTPRRACQAVWRWAVARRWRALHTARAPAALPASWLQGLRSAAHPAARQRPPSLVLSQSESTPNRHGQRSDATCCSCFLHRWVSSHLPSCGHTTVHDAAQSVTWGTPRRWAIRDKMLPLKHFLHAHELP